MSQGIDHGGCWTFTDVQKGEGEKINIMGDGR
jgi:hypothetical protein